MTTTGEEGWSVGRIGLGVLLCALAGCSSSTSVTSPLGGTAGVAGGSAAGLAGSAGGGAGSGVEEPCATYCATVMEACSGAGLAVYTSPETCMAFCRHLPEGTPEDESGNTVGCRLGQAELARATGEPDVHCPAAGPGGDGTCGDDCTAYCLVFREACPATFSTSFDGLAGCEEACDAVPNLGGYDTSHSSGFTVQCRLWHVSAATVATDPHCGHASGATGVSPCAAPATP